MLLVACRRSCRTTSPSRTSSLFSAWTSSRRTTSSPSPGLARSSASSPSPSTWRRSSPAPPASLSPSPTPSPASRASSRASTTISPRWPSTWSVPLRRLRTRPRSLPRRPRHKRGGRPRHSLSGALSEEARAGCSTRQACDLRPLVRKWCTNAHVNRDSGQCAGASRSVPRARIRRSAEPEAAQRLRSGRRCDGRSRCARASASNFLFHATGSEVLRIRREATDASTTLS
mmetsp:Transcript_29278/g.78617  ORF Transcript_29278/g.78617 Transcript_29278/m.78617 type:complete len:230 (+) Transcript_29278:1176-1865(+)